MAEVTQAPTTYAERVAFFVAAGVPEEEAQRIAIEGPTQPLKQIYAPPLTSEELAQYED